MFEGNVKRFLTRKPTVLELAEVNLTKLSALLLITFFLAGLRFNFLARPSLGKFDREVDLPELATVVVTSF